MKWISVVVHAFGNLQNYVDSSELFFYFILYVFWIIWVFEGSLLRNIFGSTIIGLRGNRFLLFVIVISITVLDLLLNY